MPSGTYHDPNIKHMFMVCTNIDQHGNVVLAPVSSWKNNLSDGTCKLAIGCHPFVTRDSHILYRKCRIEFASAIEKGLAQGIFKQLKDVNQSLIEQVIKGISISPHTPYKVKKHISSR